jgi:RNA polymerase sigma factor (sigma-70 family)
LPVGSDGVDDVEGLYRLFGGQLLRIVGAGVRAPEPLVEDACQFAWSRLVHHRRRVRQDTAVSWLITTAVREARKLARQAQRDASLEAVIGEGAEFPSPRADGRPHVWAEDRDRLSRLRALPTRQQRVAWLYGLGLTYDEIARSQGCTTRTVERQLQRARSVLRDREAG